VGNERVSIALGKPGTETKSRGGVANMLTIIRSGAVGFIDWLDGQGRQLDLRSPEAFK
jgi:hypothetical protein